MGRWWANGYKTTYRCRRETGTGGDIFRKGGGKCGIVAIIRNIM